MDDDVGTADRDAGDRAGVSADDDRAAGSMLSARPQPTLPSTSNRGSVRQARAEIAGRAADAYLDRSGQADADVVACVGIEDVDVLALLPVLEQEPVRLGDGSLR